MGYTCGTCGAVHDTLPMSFGPHAPYPWFDVPESERADRCLLDDDLCAIDEHRFVRGRIEIPVSDGSEPFVWLAWVSLSAVNFERTVDLWEQAGRECEPPYFGWLMTALPYTPSTLGLKTHVQTRPIGKRPSIELERTDHPLAIEQRDGITMARVREIAESILHPPARATSTA